MHTTLKPTTETELRTQYRSTKRQFKITTLRVQIKALETLERLMDDPESSGDPKKDAADARERNRQRLSATQTLIHCRTVQREERLAHAHRHKKQEDQRQREEAKQRTLDFKRSLYKDHPNIFPDPDAPTGPCATGRSPASAPTNEPPTGAMVGTEDAGYADSPAPAKPSPTDIGTSIAAQIIALAGSTKGFVPPA